MRHPEYERIAREIERLEKSQPAPGAAQEHAQHLELLRNRLRVAEAMTDRRTPPPDTERMITLLEKVLR